MKKGLLALLFVVAPGLLAQEAPSAQPRPEATVPAQTQSQARPAPQLGHPLDPADVDVLTGKTKPGGAPGHRLEATPYPYGSYPVNVAGYLPSRSLGSNSLASPPLVPLLFGRARGRSFFLIGNTTAFGPPLLFFSRGRTGSSTFFFAPTRPGFFFFRR